MAKKAKKRKYSKGAAKKVGRAMKKRKAGTLKSGRSGKKVKSRKQAITIGHSEARKKKWPGWADRILTGCSPSREAEEDPKTDAPPRRLYRQAGLSS
jgi:hypothetical protein